MTAPFAVLFLLAVPRLPEHADPVVDYRISVRLDAVTKRLQGTQRLAWRNPSAGPVSDLWFHLYLNAFKNSRSTFFRESGGQIRGERMAADKWGWIDVTSLRLEDGTDLMPARRFEHPDDDNAEDRTVMRVALPRPVPPGGRVSIDVGFNAQLPRVFARTGYVRDFYLVGQWFPKLGVYEPAGTRGRKQSGWNCHQFHALSEFYADYGRYRVDITLPSRFVVGATGRLVDRRETPDQLTTHTYEQDDVHDFAWTADPGFVEVKRRFSAMKDVTPGEYAEAARRLGRTPDEVRLSDVEIVLLMQPSHLPQLERQVRTAKLAIKLFGLWYGRYPYGTLTLVDPAPGAHGASGMEYPTFVTVGTSFLRNRWPFHRLLLTEQTLVHELGHQYWYGLVGNNEFEEPWLDEGFTSYSAGKVMEAGYGKDASFGEMLGLRLGEIELMRAFNGPTRTFDKVRWPSWKYSSRGGLGFSIYAKPELALRTLENLLGEDTMARVMRTYHERWRFRHPGSDDFYAVAQEVSGRDLRPFFDQVVEGTGVVDYEVASVESRRVPVARGILDGGTVLETDARERERKDEARPYESTVLVRRRGEVVLPVEVEMRFQGAPPERRGWHGRDRWIRYEVTRPQKLVSARVDPDGKLLLDVSVLNNARRIRPDSRTAAHWAARWLFWAQQLLALVGM